MKRNFAHFAVVSGATLAALLLTASQPQAADNGVLKVCADSDYMPYSNQAGQGFENKVAAVVAKAMGRKLQLVFGHYRGKGGFQEYMARNLDAGKCDVVMNLPTGNVDEAYTNPYYSSSYVFVTKKNLNQDVSAMSSRALRTMKIGFEVDTPPADALKILGYTSKDVLMFDVGEDAGASPQEMLDAVESGKIGTAITWQPAIGYFLKNYPDLKTSTVPPAQVTAGVPAMQFTFPMSMAVRQKDNNTRTALNQVIKAHKAEIDAVLKQYQVFAPPAPKTDIFQ